MLLPRPNFKRPNMVETSVLLCNFIMLRKNTDFLSLTALIDFRYSPKGLPEMPSCGHRGRKNCSLLKMQDISRFHKASYSEKSKSSQDAFLLKYCATYRPERKRPRNGVRGEKTVSFDYFVESVAGNKIEICRQAFLGILGITKHRVI